MCELTDRGRQGAAAGVLAQGHSPAAQTQTPPEKDGSPRVWAAGAHEWRGVPTSEPGQGGRLGVAERARALEAVQRGGVPPHRERTEGRRQGKRGSRAGGCPALPLHHRPAVYAPVSAGHR